MMATVTIQIRTKIYGRKLGFSIARLLGACGVSESTCIKVAMVLLLVRIDCGEKSAWHWGARLGR